MRKTDHQKKQGSSSRFGTQSLEVPVILFSSIPFFSLIFLFSAGTSFGMPLIFLSFASLAFAFFFVKVRSSRLQGLEVSVNSLKSKCRLIAKSSHNFIVDMVVELRRPLHGIIGTKQLFKKDDFTDEQRSLYDIVDFCSNHLLKKLERIQFYSEAESEQTMFPEIISNVRELVSGCVAKAQGNMVSPNVQVNVTIDDDVPVSSKLKVDAFSAVLGELLENSTRHTESGQIHVGVEVDRSEGDALLVTVSDSGPGLSRLLQKQVSETFAAMNSEAPWNRRITGLGFNICKSILRNAGGQIWLDSNSTSGSTFCFRLPFTPIAQQAETKRTAQDQGLMYNDLNLSGQPHDSNAQILIVDDEPFARTVLTTLIANQGFKCDAAANGAEAVAACQAHSYKLVFMDIQMPVMDGWEATEEILKNCDDHHPQIVALTSHTRPSDKRQCQKSGMKGFLPKPIRNEALRDVLAQFNLQADISEVEPPQSKTEESAPIATVTSLEDYRARKKTRADSAPTQTLPAVQNVNFDKLYSYYDHDLGRCIEVLKKGLGAIDERLKKMMAARSRMDFREIAFEAHQINGEFAYIMCDKGVSISEQLENCEDFKDDIVLIDGLIKDIRRIYLDISTGVGHLTSVDQASLPKSA